MDIRENDSLTKLNVRTRKAFEELYNQKVFKFIIKQRVLNLS